MFFPCKQLLAASRMARERENEENDEPSISPSPELLDMVEVCPDDLQPPTQKAPTRVEDVAKENVVVYDRERPMNEVIFLE